MSSDNADSKDWEREAVRIDPHHLQADFVRVPADLAFANALYADALESYLRAKIRLSRTEALLALQHREQLLLRGTKATESQVAAHVTSDPIYQAAEDALLEAETRKVHVQGTCEAIRAKRDMIVSLGATIRAELQGDPALRSRRDWASQETNIEKER